MAGQLLHDSPFMPLRLFSPVSRIAEMDAVKRCIKISSTAPLNSFSLLKYVIHQFHQIIYNRTMTFPNLANFIRSTTGTRTSILLDSTVFYDLSSNAHTFQPSFAHTHRPTIHR